MDVVGEPVGAMHSTQRTDLRRPRQTAGRMARGRAITAPRDGACRLAGIRSERTHRHPSRCRRARRPDLVPLRYGRMLRSPFTLYRASVGDSLIALSLVAAKHAGRKTDLGLDAAQNPLVRHSLAKKSGRRARTKTVIPLLRDRWFKSGSLQRGVCELSVPCCNGRRAAALWPRGRGEGCTRSVALFGSHARARDW